MRHGNSGRKFSMTPDVRKAMLRNISDSLIMNGRIKTTVLISSAEIDLVTKKTINFQNPGTISPPG